MILHQPVHLLCWRHTVLKLTSDGHTNRCLWQYPKVDPDRVETQLEFVRWLTIPSRMARCFHDVLRWFYAHFRFAKFPYSWIHQGSISGQCDASISKTRAHNVSSAHSVCRWASLDHARTLAVAGRGLPRSQMTRSGSSSPSAPTPRAHFMGRGCDRKGST